MTTNILYLFPDTNLFLECITLKNIDWSLLGEYSEINLLLSKPVLDELDKHKKGSGRRRRQATDIFKMARDILRKPNQPPLNICNAPLVNLHLCSDNHYQYFDRPSLDLSKTDDLLVACVGGYQEQNPDQQVSLLTHDIAPMTTCRNHGVSFIEIPDTWIRPVEITDTQKENERLRKEISELLKKEPSFTITARMGSDDTERVEYEHPYYPPLNNKAIDNYLSLLKHNFPPMNFPRNPGFGNEFLALTQPPQSQIDKYYKDYRAWLDACRDKLSRIHLYIQARVGHPKLHIAIANIGNAPGNDVLVKLQAKGNFKLKHLAERSIFLPDQISFPSPPDPPKGELMTPEWALKGSEFHVSTRHITDSIGASIHRNKDQFYPINTTARINDILLYECELFKQTLGEQILICELIPMADSPGLIRGVVEVSVVSTNNALSVTKNIPIAIIPKLEDNSQEVVMALNMQLNC